MDSHPRRLTGFQVQALEIAAAHLSARLELRLGVLQLLEERALRQGPSAALRERLNRQRELSGHLVQDLRGPLAGVASSSQYLAGKLALWVVRQIDRALGGRVAVSRTRGVGSSFTLELPFGGPVLA